MTLISASILSANFAVLGDEIKAIEAAGADWIHIDVMDGHFVPNISMGPVIVSTVRRLTHLPLDVHLMIHEPMRYLSDFASSGADIITVHYEACSDARETLSRIKALGKKAGLSIKPDTTLESISQLLDSIDLLLIMTVSPGFAGQSFLPKQLAKIKQAKQIKDSRHLPFMLQVDGGINSQTAALVKQNGATVLVAASAIFKQSNYALAISELRQA